MAKKYRICARLEIDGKTVWPDTGMVLSQRDDGKMTLYDPRTGQSYFAFEKEPRPASQQQAPQQQQKPNDPFDDDIPF